jgi:hypothetical protein
MADRSQPTDADAAAQTVFAVLAETFRQRLGEGSEDETWNMALFVYDSARLAVRPVLWYGPWMADADWRNFEIPLGKGIAGAAFVHRGIIPWMKGWNTHFRPHLFPGASVELRCMLSVPVYHRDVENHTFPSPWGTIGVVSFGSSALATQIPALLSPLSPGNSDMLTLLRGYSQAHVHEILRHLGGPRAS